MLAQSMRFFKEAHDTASYMDASIAQAKHLRSLERKREAFRLIDSLSSEMPTGIQRMLNQELLGFSFEDKDFGTSLEIIDRQIKLADNEGERLNFEIKKITPLLSLGRSVEAAAFCDSLFSLPHAPEIGSNEWRYMRVNYAAALEIGRAHV